jgi:hypothetical protein
LHQDVRLPLFISSQMAGEDKNILLTSSTTWD